MHKRILIYTEGGLNLGMGNVYRSISLAKSVLESDGNIEIEFVTSSTDYIVTKIEENGFKCIKTDLIQDCVIERKPQLLIIDFLNIAPEFVKEIKYRCGCKIAIIGNLNLANNYADLVVNAIIGTGFINSETIDEFGTKYLKGPKYLVLRNEFEQVRDSYKYRGILKNIVLLFGGSDAQNHTCSTIEKLVNDFQITAIVGSGFEYNNELDKYSDRVKIYRNINNVSEVLLANDFLITSPGTALFEAFCVGVPAISLFQNQSQRDVFGDFVTTNNAQDIDILNEVNSIYRNYLKYKQNIDALQIGLGKKDIINNLLKLI